MIYSEVMNNGWILPKKDLYTMKDVNKLVTESLFGRYGKTLSKKEAVFIVKCSALYHDTDYSRSVTYWNETKEFLSFR